MKQCMWGTTGVCLAMAPLAAWAHAPEPIGTANITFRYMMANGEERVLTDVRDFSGRDHEDATPLDGDDNINCFFSVNAFGIRQDIRGGLADHEALIAFTFFKDHMDHSRNFFSDIASEDTIITVEITGIQFAEPVTLVGSTFLMHRFWDADQVDQLDNFYINLHNYGLSTDLWRDIELFFPNPFTDFPVPNYRPGEMTTAMSVDVQGSATDNISLTFAFPYKLFKHYEETGQTVPPGLPAPFGYLEPFHFHFEGVFASDEEDPCPSVKRIHSRCKHGTIVTKLKARLDAGTLLTVESDGEWHAAEIGADKRASVSFTPRGDGEHTINVIDCPGLSHTVSCGG